MISFKEFLFESEWQKTAYANGSYRGYQHEAMIGNHHVRVYFRRHELDGYGHHEIGFDVDGGIHSAKSNVMPHRSMEILQHVHRKIGEFLTQHKDKFKSLEMTANEPAKRKLYDAMAQRIAKTHGLQHTKRTIQAMMGKPEMDRHTFKPKEELK